MRADEKKMCFFAERTGWDLTTEENRIVLSISSGRFCNHDRNRIRETFVYKLFPESLESMWKEVQLTYEGFVPSDYAYFLQDEYLKKHRDAATPPVLTIAKFAEYVDGRLFALSEALAGYLNPDPFSKKIIGIAERNGFDVFTEDELFSDRFSFWYLDKHLNACVKYDPEKNLYPTMEEKRKAEILLEDLYESLYDAVMLSKRPVPERAAWWNIAKGGIVLADDIASEFGVDALPFSK